MERYAPDLQTYVRTPLSAHHVARLRAAGEVVHFATGETLIDLDTVPTPFFYILEGEAAPFDAVTGEPYSTTTLGPTQFAGELSFLTGGRSLLVTRAASDVTAIRVERDVMLALMAREPEMSDIIITVFAARRRRLAESGRAGLTLIGAEADRQVRRVEAFATQSRIPHRSHALGSAEALAMASACGIEPGTPAVVLGESAVITNPSPRRVAQAVGLDLAVAEGEQFDVAIVGAGPSGLAAGVYAGAEGLRALVIDANAVGGQAATSSRIENYMGFPTGISGADLCARGEIQALKFGTRFAVPRQVCALQRTDTGFTLELDDGVSVAARAVVVASGVQYRRLPLERLADFEGAGVYYAATELEARHLGQSAAIVVGGGNSAGQAAMFLATRAQRVVLVVRGGSLAASMSDYLISRIEQNPHIEVRYHTHVSALHGDEMLSGVTLQGREDGDAQEIAATGLFIMVGAAPNTGWLADLAELDAKGFVVTGADHTSTCPGIFAVGDVRAGSVKRVASAVGEGSVVISQVWQYLAQSPRA
jgi:thioredoxin reductase (NADPH)